MLAEAERNLLAKKIAAYQQQAEVMLANFHRLKGAAIALEELLNEERQGQEATAEDGTEALLPLSRIG